MISLLGQSGYPGPRGESGVSIVPHAGEQNREEFVMKHQLRRCQTSTRPPVSEEGNYHYSSAKQTVSEFPRRADDSVFALN